MTPSSYQPMTRNRVRNGIGFTELVPGLYGQLDWPDLAGLHLPGALMTVDGLRNTLYPLALARAAVSYLDAQVGRVLNALNSLDLRENTIIVFWSDHGLHIGEHGLTRKTTVFELDSRVPLIVATPRHTPGQRTDALVELLDLYPTLAALCELKAPREVEGFSLVPLLNDPNAKGKDFALTQTPRPNYLRGALPKVMGYSIRTERYRYTEWRDFQAGDVQARELYDHNADPLETANLARHADRKATLAELAERLSQALLSANAD